MRFKELFRKRFGNIVFFADGDGGGGGETPAWHTDYAYLSENPEASKAFSKYKEPNDAFKGAHEAMKKVGRSFWLPDDHSKLTDEQKNEIRANVAKMEGVPETPDGYDLKIEKGDVSIDEQGIADFKVFAKENNIPVELAKKLLTFQTSFVNRLNKFRNDAIKEITTDSFKQFSKDCGGEANAVMRMQWIKELLQSKCLNSDGKPDKDIWESFAKRIMSEDRVIELPLLRALAEPAQKARGTGGAPAGQPASAVAKGALDYPEMDKKK